MIDRSDPLGFDVYVGPVPGGTVDIAPGGASGVQLVINNMVARSTSDTLPRLGAVGDCIPFGVDVRSWVGEAVDEDTAGERERILSIVYARDSRIDAGSIAVKVAAAVAGSIYAFTITVHAMTVTGGPIALVMGINSVTVDVLAQGAVS